MRGHVRERGKGNWYAVLSIHDPGGRRKVKWRKLSATGKRQAEAECARLITEIRNGGYCESDRVTVGQFLQRWLEYISTQVSLRTHERYAEIAHKNIIPALGAIQLTKLQPTLISAQPMRTRLPVAAAMAMVAFPRAPSTTCTAFSSRHSPRPLSGARWRITRQG